MQGDPSTTSLVSVGPYLDVRSVATVRTAVNAALSTDGGDVVLDFHEVLLLDAAGLGMLTAAHLRAERAGRRLVLRSCSDEIRRVLAVTRLSRVLHVERSLELSV